MLNTEKITHLIAVNSRQLELSVLAKYTKTIKLDIFLTSDIPIINLLLLFQLSDLINS